MSEPRERYPRRLLIVGASLAGLRAPQAARKAGFDGELTMLAPPYFWSDQYDVKIQSVGLPARAERLELLECTPDRSRLVYAGERAGHLIAVIAINAARRLGTYRMAVADSVAFEELRARVAADPGALGMPVTT